VPFSAFSKANCPGDFLLLSPPEGFDGRSGEVFVSGSVEPSVDISAASITTGLVEFLAVFFLAASVAVGASSSELGFEVSNLGVKGISRVPAGTASEGSTIAAVANAIWPGASRDIAHRLLRIALLKTKFSAFRGEALPVTLFFETIKALFPG
jgi:hypothetical protein